MATACPGVAECACIGVPDEKTGEAVKLFVVKAPGATLTEADVIAHCRKELDRLQGAEATCASSRRCRSRPSARSCAGSCAIWPEMRSEIKTGPQR